jgi:hypothetical protein
MRRSPRDALGQHDLIQVTGYEQHLQVRPLRREPFGHLPSAQLGHDDVGDQQIDGPRLRCSERERALSIRGCENALKGRSCCVVLIGAKTADRPLVRYEIKRARELKLAMFGVRVHNLRDTAGLQSARGDNPFEHPDTALDGFAANVPVFDSPETDSKLAYRHIVDNLTHWAELAVKQTGGQP